MLLYLWQPWTLFLLLPLGEQHNLLAMLPALGSSAMAASPACMGHPTLSYYSG